MQFFVKTVGHYASHIRWEANGQGRFQERAFYKALPSKANRRFVKKFVKTQLFSLFIQEAEKSKNPPAGRQPAPLPPRPAGSPRPWPCLRGGKGTSLRRPQDSWHLISQLEGKNSKPQETPPG